MVASPLPSGVLALLVPLNERVRGNHFWFESSGEVLFFCRFSFHTVTFLALLKTPNGCPFCTNLMVTVKVQVPVCVRLLPVDSYVKSPTLRSC